jgi:hypothetical protein
MLIINNLIKIIFAERRSKIVNKFVPALLEKQMSHLLDCQIIVGIFTLMHFLLYRHPKKSLALILILNSSQILFDIGFNTRYYIAKIGFHKWFTGDVLV